MDSGTTVTQIGKYQVLGVLGVGGMGVVYRGLDKSMGREVAIKTLTEASRRSDFRSTPSAARVNSTRMCPLVNSQPVGDFVMETSAVAKEASEQIRQVTDRKSLM